MEVEVPVSKDEFLKCPVCEVYISIDEMNCGEFRCGRTIYGYINPHASAEEIEQLFRNNCMIGGCGARLLFNQTTKKLNSF